MDVATIVLIPFENGGDSSEAAYHIRFSTKKEGPQRGGNVKVLDVLYRKEGELESDFQDRVVRYVNEVL